MAERTQSPAYEVLRPSVKRLLQYIETEIQRQGGCAMLYDDQLEMIGSARIYMSGSRELHALGFVVHSRPAKQNRFTLSEAWRDVSKRDAALIVARARMHPNAARGRRKQTAADGATA